jgi:hypothetical protein
MLALSQVFAAILELVPEPPGWRPRGPVDPRVDPEALAAFALAEIAHPELPLRFAFERAQDAREVLRPSVPDTGEVLRPGVPDTPTARWSEPPTDGVAVMVPAVHRWADTDRSGDWIAGDRGEAEWPLEPLGVRIIRPGSAFRSDRPD